MGNTKRQCTHVPALRTKGLIRGVNELRLVVCGTREVPVRIVRMRRKTMAIHVFADRPVELRAPLKCPWSEINAFLESRLGWINESLATLAVQCPPRPPQYTDGESHSFMGRSLRLSLIEGKTLHVGAVGNEMLVRCRDTSDNVRVEDAIARFYRTEALKLLPARVQLCRERFQDDLPVKAVTVRKMRARWGSCSSAGEICLNTQLIQKSLAAIDFVVTHELCHLRHFPHNKSFYALMDKVMPDWREREKLLVADKATLQLDLF